jgi:hypothetical protein
MTPFFRMFNRILLFEAGSKTQCIMVSVSVAVFSRKDTLYDTTKNLNQYLPPVINPNTVLYCQKIHIAPNEISQQGVYYM